MTNRMVISGVDVIVEIAPSALRHGKTQEDILLVIENAIHDETVETDPNKTLFIGFDRNANLTEMLVHIASDEHIVVYHAMNCRKVYLERIIK